MAPMVQVVKQQLPIENGNGYSLIDVEKKRLFKKLVLYCPIILGLSIFVSLSSMINLLSYHRYTDFDVYYGIDFITLLETIDMILLIVAFVFICGFIKNRLEYLTRYPFTANEKKELKISFGFMVFMYAVDFSFQTANAIIVGYNHLYELCNDYYYNGRYSTFNEYGCSNSQYFIVISSLMAVIDLIGIIMGIIAACTSAKFTNSPINPKPVELYNSDMEKNHRNHILCFTCPTVFSCIATYLSILAFTFLLTRYNTSEYGYIQSFVVVTVYGIFILISVLIANIGLCRYIDQRKEIVTHFSSDKERKQYIISYSFQIILALITFSFMIAAICIGAIEDPLTITILSIVSVISGLHILVSPGAICISRKFYAKRYEEQMYREIEKQFNNTNNQYSYPPNYINTGYNRGVQQYIPQNQMQHTTPYVPAVPNISRSGPVDSDLEAAIKASLSTARDEMKKDPELEAAISASMVTNYPKAPGMTDNIPTAPTFI